MTAQVGMRRGLDTSPAVELGSLLLLTGCNVFESVSSLIATTKAEVSYYIMCLVMNRSLRTRNYLLIKAPLTTTSRNPQYCLTNFLYTNLKSLSHNVDTLKGKCLL